MSGTTTFAATTSSVLGYVCTGEAVVARRTAPAVAGVKGTGLPIGGHAVRTLDRIRPSFAVMGAHTSALGVGVMGADQVPATAARIPATADQWDPPRRTPSRC